MSARGLLVLLLVLLLPAGGCKATGAVSRVVLVTFDTTRADHLGCYGAEGDPTPNLDRLAAESVVFEQAIAPTPTTLPSHATLFTGLYPQDHGIRYNLFFRLPPAVQTLAETLREHGFKTAGFPASRILSASFGLDQGFETYDEPTARPEPRGDHPLGGISRTAGEGVDLALDWLAEAGDDPFFLWLHLYDPHEPYEPPFPHSSRFRDRPYAGEIAYADAELGRLLDRLRDGPRWSETLLVVAGDHGEGLYAHGERWHAFLVYETTQRVPLIVRAPGIRASRVEEPVGLAGVAPTILDLAGVEPADPSRGASLRAALEGDDPPSRPIYFETLAGSLVYGWAELRGLRSGRWKLIDSSDPELYDLEADPEEETNLAAREPARVEALREELLREAESIVTVPASGARPGAEMLEVLAGLGYVGGGGGSPTVGEPPDPREMIDLEVELLTAHASVSREDWDYVEDLSRYVLERDPTNKWAMVHVGLALLRLGKTDEALERALAAVRTYPDFEQTHAMLANVHWESGRRADALEALGQGLRFVPDSETLRYHDLVAAFELELGDVCAERMARAAAAHAESGRILALKARCEARRGEVGLALATLRSAVDHGFTWLGLVEETEDFSAIVALPAFRELRERAEADRGRP